MCQGSGFDPPRWDRVGEREKEREREKGRERKRKQRMRR
jgi:hypothetical protein